MTEELWVHHTVIRNSFTNSVCYKESVNKERNMHLTVVVQAVTSAYSSILER